MVDTKVNQKMNEINLENFISQERDPSLLLFFKTSCLTACIICFKF